MIRTQSVNIMLVLRLIPSSNEIALFLGYFEEPMGYAMKLYSANLTSFIFDPNQNLTSLDVFKICNDVLMGLVYLRSYGIVHFDIHPGNILLEFGTQIQAVISDFGVSFFKS